MKNHAKASTFAIRTSQPHKAKIAKEYGLANADGQVERKESQQRTSVLRNGGLNASYQTFR